MSEDDISRASRGFHTHERPRCASPPWERDESQGDRVLRIDMEW